MLEVDSTQLDALQPQHVGDPVRAARYVAGALINEKYLLEARLGRGGMGTVWLAQHVMLESSVALKLIDPSIQRSDTIERFRNEARLEARFNHPNIVRVFDFGHTEHGDPFIVMEVLDGVTLGDLIRQRGRLTPTDAVQTVLPIIDALCHVHARGVVHRDLKPDNILLSRNDVDTSPKLLDFGVAKLISEQLCARPTDTHALIGSPGYMAPEQVQATENIDYRVDIWAMCVVLYEAVSGKHAFPGEGIAPLRAAVETPVPPLEDTGAGESELFAVLARGLEKDPELRFQSMSELGNALAQWLYDRGEREDLNGGRLSRSWSLAPAPVPEPEPPRLRLDVAEIDLGRLAEPASVEMALVAEDMRRQSVMRSVVVAVIVLVAVAVPSNLRFEDAVRVDYVSAKAQQIFARVVAASADVHAMIAD